MKLLDFLSEAEKAASSGGTFAVTLKDFRALIDLALAFRKAREGYYCNVPDEVYEAMDRLEKEVTL